MSENEIQRILDKLEDLREDMHQQRAEWHKELNDVKMNCAAKSDCFKRMENFMDVHGQTNEQWLEGTVGRKTLLILSGASGAVGLIILQQLMSNLAGLIR